MSTWWKSGRLFSPIACCLVTLVASAASAEPIRLTVTFTVGGDDRDDAIDPDFGTTTASGRFTVVTNVPVGGGTLEDETGLGAHAVSFTFAGRSWTIADADAYRLIFDHGGR